MEGFLSSKKDTEINGSEKKTGSQMSAPLYTLVNPEIHYTHHFFFEKYFFSFRLTDLFQSVRRKDSGRRRRTSRRVRDREN